MLNAGTSRPTQGRGRPGHGTPPTLRRRPRRHGPRHHGVTQHDDLYDGGHSLLGAHAEDAPTMGIAPYLNPEAYAETSARSGPTSSRRRTLPGAATRGTSRRAASTETPTMRPATRTTAPPRARAAPGPQKRPPPTRPCSRVTASGAGTSRGRAAPRTTASHPARATGTRADDAGRRRLRPRSAPACSGCPPRWPSARSRWPRARFPVSRTTSWEASAPRRQCRGRGHSDQHARRTGRHLGQSREPDSRRRQPREP